MATLTAVRPRHKQFSLLDPHENQPPRSPQPRPADTRPAPDVAAASPAGTRPAPDVALTAAAACATDSRHSAPSSARTLDDLVAGVWDTLMVTHSAACLVCGTPLTPRWSSGPHPVAARCGGCESELS